MRLEQLDLVAYGHLAGLQLDLVGSAPGLTLVLGPNEAGKSTTMRALTALLFGFERGTPDHFGRGRESLRVGGRLVGSDGTVLQVVRQGLARQPLVGADGAAVAEGDLAAVLGGADRALFTSLFRVNHRELRDRSEELLDGDGELGRLVFGAGLGSASLTDLLASLQRRRDALFLPRGRDQEIPRALKQIRDLRSEVQELRVHARDWERARRAEDAAERRVAELRAERAEARLAHERLVRLQGALPVLAARNAALAERQSVLAAGPVQTQEWADRAGQLLGERAEAQADARSSASQLQRLAEQLRQVTLAPDLLGQADAIDDLVAGIDRYRKDTDDLPDLRGRLTTLQEGVADLSSRLGLDLAHARALTDPQLDEVDRLAGELAAAEAASGAAAEEAHRSASVVAALQRELAGAAELPDAGAVRQRLQAAGPELGRRAEMAAMAAEADRARGDVRAGLGRLGLDPARDPEGLPLPDRSEVRRALARRADLQAAAAQLSERLRGEDAEAADLERQAAELAGAPGLPDADAVAAARRRRDAIWTAVRRHWLGARPAPADGSRAAADAAASGTADGGTGAAGTVPQELAVTMERAIADADRADDDRFAHASQLERLSAVQARLRTASERRAAVREQLHDARVELDRWAEGWAALWTARGLPPVAPEDGADRLDDLAALQQQAEAARRQQVAVDQWHRACDEHRQALAAALAAAGAVPAHEELAALAVQADELVAAVAAAAAERAALDRRLGDARDEDRRRREDAARAAAEVEGSRGRWGDALVPLHLPASTSPETARAVVASVRQLRNDLRQADDLRRRVAGLERDIAGFAGRVAATAGAVAPQLAGLDVVGAVGELRRRLQDARTAEDRHHALQDELDELTGRHEQAADRLARCDAALAELRAAAGIAPDEPLDAHLERAGQARRLGERIEQAEAQLLAQGAGPTVEAVVAAAAEHDADASRVDVAVREAHDRMVGLDEELATAADELGAARQAVARVDGSGRAAAAEQQAEVALAGLSGAVDQYARVALAREVLRRVVEDYGRRNQAPLLSRAGDHFTRLTGGGFSGLLADGGPGAQRLLARRRDGRVHEVAELSEGTIDQLYLAFRLAGIEHHLDRAAEPLPVVLDDILVNFDDERAAAALGVLAELGLRTQVLLFTHHRHVAELARGVLGPSRLHVAELAPVSQAAPGPGEGALAGA